MPLKNIIDIYLLHRIRNFISQSIKVNYVTLGDHKCRSYDYGETIIAAKDWQLHPEYNSTTVVGKTKDGEEKLDQILYYDFAIIILQSTVSFSSTILPACLPKNSKNDYAWARAQTSGWGLLQNEDSEGRRKRVNKLMKVSLTVLPYPLCKNASKRESGLDEKYVDPSHMLCVGSATPLPSRAAKGIWQGDSGGKFYSTKFLLLV